MEKNFFEAGGKESESKGLAKERLADLRKIFKDYEINLQEKTRVGQINFEQIREQMQGVRDQYQALLNSPEIRDEERGKYRVELEEMDDILLKAIITEAAE